MIIILIVMMIIAFLVYGKRRVSYINSLLRAGKDANKIDKDESNPQLERLKGKVHSLFEMNRDEHEVKNTIVVSDNSTSPDQSGTEPGQPTNPASNTLPTLEVHM